jgi:hypothetical protein
MRSQRSRCYLPIHVAATGMLLQKQREKGRGCCRAAPEIIVVKKRGGGQNLFFLENAKFQSCRDNNVVAKSAHRGGRQLKPISFHS